ncbi:MAG: SBBP repeat-containing protein [Candidatus Aminicenantes bacterium]|nr:SBBP repeat-containing protein [Candidatus Aminicenantes bacterium]
MKRLIFLILFYFVFLGLILISNFGQEIENQQLTGKTTRLYHTSAVTPGLNFGNFLLYFILNKGQVSENARFYAKTPKYTLWLTKEGFVFDSVRRKNRKKNHKLQNTNDKQITSPKSRTTNKAQSSPHHSSLTKYVRNVSRLLFVGANKNPGIVPFKTTKHKVSYFIGDDKTKWHTNIPTSLAVMYKNLYQNIDLKVYGKEKQIEYDWIVKPGANPTDIKFTYKGVKGTHIDKQGNLVVETQFGEILHQMPICYQEISTGQTRVEVKGQFKKITGDTYGFTVGKYDKTCELIIDPVVELAYSTYLGGSDADYGMGIAFDGTYVYVTGYTDSTNFPTLNDYQSDQGSTDAFITKIDPSQSGGACLLYSTYLGGGGDDEGRGIAVDSSENVYITGCTMSVDFPIENAFQPTNPPSADAFVTRIDTNENGGDSLIYSSYLGGNAWDEGYGIACDNEGNAFITGYAQGAGFPTTTSRYSDYQGAYDAFLIQIDTDLSGAAGFMYSTYLGGGGYEWAYAIALDSSGKVYVIGKTDSSTTFPTLNAYQTASGGSDDVFVTKIDPTQIGASSLLYSTYLGGTNIDEGWGIAVDDSGNAYLTGKTNSTNFPTLNPYQSALAGSYDAFVTRIDTSQSGINSFIYSTYLGHTAQDEGFGITVDSIGSVFVTGVTYSTDFPTLNQYQTNQVDADVFVTRLKIHDTGTSYLLYSTYLGDTGLGIGGDDFGRGIVVDSSGNSAYVTGYTASTNFPILNQYMPDPGDSNADAFVTKLNSPKFLVVESPNGGEVWSFGRQKIITWTSLGLTNNMKISLLRNGVSVGVIATGVDPAPGSYTWLQTGHLANGNPVALGGGYTIKIKEIGTAITDTSDNSFYLNGITVTAPTCDAPWPLEETKRITWGTDNVANYVKITLDGEISGTIVGAVPYAQGYYDWVVGELVGGIQVRPGPDYKIKVKEKLSTVSDTTCGFKITGIAVTAPVLNDEWGYGTTQNITWKNHGITGGMKITLWQNGIEVGTIEDGLTPDQDEGSTLWQVGQIEGGVIAYPGPDYYIKIEEIGTTVCGVGDIFDITGIALVYPIGGELLDPNTSVNIEWICHKVTNNLKINLKKDGLFKCNIANNLLPDSSPHPWTVGECSSGPNQPPGYNYTIIIKDPVIGISDVCNVFDIKGINVLSPNGGENWEIWTAQKITWEAPGVTQKLRINLLYIDEYQKKIAGNLTPADGSYGWYIDDVVGGNYYKIQIVSASFVSDKSDSNFTISE